MRKIRLPKTGKIERTYKLKLFIDSLMAAVNRLRTSADGLESVAVRTNTILRRN